MAHDVNEPFIEAFKEVHTPDSFARALIGHVLRAAPGKMSQSSDESVEFNARFSVARPGKHATTTQGGGLCICITVDGWEICGCLEV
ncbi:hypothetical protein [Streptomyces sp. NPDC018031]|uniref:hypothetical protein n=1 Tax=Streptomyces sp. NPDC018031 TaxID=3365033 RepID=UPI00378778A5